MKTALAAVTVLDAVQELFKGSFAHYKITATSRDNFCLLEGTDESALYAHGTIRVKGAADSIIEVLVLGRTAKSLPDWGFSFQKAVVAEEDSSVIVVEPWQTGTKYVFKQVEGLV